MAKVTPMSLAYECDGFDTLEGYVDAAGTPRCLVKVRDTVAHPESSNRIEIIDGRDRKPAIEIPGEQFETWIYAPKLLLDAHGRQHVIAMSPRGENATICDYVVGSGQEPTIVRASVDVVGKLQGFEAFQGPARCKPRSLVPGRGRRHVRQERISCDRSNQRQARRCRQQRVRSDDRGRKLEHSDVAVRAILKVVRSSDSARTRISHYIGRIAKTSGARS